MKPDPAAKESPTATNPLEYPCFQAPSIPDHELLRCIGSGSYGEVWLARSVMGTFRAVKVVQRQTFERAEHFEREFRGIQKFEPISRSHDGFVDILQIGRNDDAGYFYYVMELADDANDECRRANVELPPFVIRNSEFYIPKTLRAAIFGHLSTLNPQPVPTRLPVSDCVDIGVTLASALAHLHKHGLVHRDIKPSNIIFVGGVPKLADIGLVADASEARSFVGTVGFIPPEGPGSPQADLYSLGKVLYEISTGQDRQDFPQLPPELLRGEPLTRPADTLSHPMGEGRGEGNPKSEMDQSLLTSAARNLIELNEVLLKACHKDLRQRYPSADAMLADLKLLQRGQSVQRKHAAERCWTLAMRMSLAVAAMASLVAVLPYVKFGKPPRTSAPLAEITSIAVLPFVNESKQSQDKYLSDALTDEAMQAFTNIAGLRVAPRQSVFAFKGTNANPCIIGEQLGVRTVLAGSLKKTSNQLHVTARLIRVADGSNVWAASFDRDDRYIGAMQSEMVQQVARQLNLSIEDRALRQLEMNLVRKLAAYQIWKEGWKELNKQTKDGIAQSIDCFNRAIEIDPHYALAYCHLADAYWLASRLVVPPVQALAEMRNKARRAVEIDDNLPDGHKYLGLALFSDFDIAGGEREFKRAIELGPNDPWTYNFYALLLRCTGRVTEAGKVQLKALELDPINSPVWACRQLCAERRFEEALDLARRYAQGHSNSVLAPMLLGEAYMALNQFEEAAAELKKVRAMDADPQTIGSLGYVLARLGRTNEARALLKELDHLRGNLYVSAAATASVYAGLGETNEAIRQLQLAYEERSPALLSLKIEGRWDGLRADPRFKLLLKKMGLEK